MSEKKTVAANDLESQVINLLERYEKLKEKNRQLTQELEVKQKELTEANAKIVELNTNYSRLKLAKAYGWDEKSKREANNRISKLVRDIDKCLGLLNEID